MSDFIEGLPAPVRHVAAAFIGAYVAVLVAAVTSAGGVTSVDWNGTLVDGLNKAALAAVGVLGTLYVTPLTDAYGVGKKEPEPAVPLVALEQEEVDEPAEGEVDGVDGH
jgi:hypothetical protein